MNIVNPYIFVTEAPYVGDGSFAMEFKTTSANTTVYLPIRSSDTSGKLVFDDGTSDVIGNPDQATHTFANAGTYIIKYYGTATSLAWGTATTAQKQFLTKILDWGITGATSASFRYCSSLLSVASNLESTTTSLYNCFANSTGNPDVSLLDTSNVTNMKRMFYNATSFNQDIGGWDVSNVTNMEAMLRNTSFNQDISSWDVSDVINMRQMFTLTRSFNQDIGGWDVSNVTNMSSMFYVDSAFNQDISSWDVSNVANMSYMFYIAASADPDMSSWNFSSVTNYAQMLNSSGITTTNYDGFLNKLNADRITYSLTGRAIGDIPSTYTTSVSGAARTALLANGWTFTDDGGV
tara:strand:+ start:1008 stop:2054 length:1047 start_codon:yes stop_codon:yes gene_type:complete